MSSMRWISHFHTHSHSTATMASIRSPATRLFTSHICRQCARTLAKRPLLQQAGKAHFSQQPRRFKQPYVLDHDPKDLKTDYKLPQLETKVYSFDQVKELSQSPEPERILIGKPTRSPQPPAAPTDCVQMYENLPNTKMATYLPQ